MIPSIKQQMALGWVQGILISMTSQMNPGAFLESKFHSIQCGLFSEKTLNLRILGNGENFLDFRFYTVEEPASCGICMCNSDNSQSRCNTGWFLSICIKQRSHN
jgi:hypothetical protein